jgi:hypothetical protein
MPTGPKASLDFALATNIAKKRGFNDFKEGSAGAAERSKVAEDIASGQKSKKAAPAKRRAKK